MPLGEHAGAGAFIPTTRRRKDGRSCGDRPRETEALPEGDTSRAPTSSSCAGGSAQTYAQFDQQAIRVLAHYNAAPLNPEAVSITDSAAMQRREGGFHGWTFAELVVLNRYRRRAV